MTTEELIEQHLDVAQHCVWKYVGMGWDYDDLISEAYYSLVKAARTYRPDRGATFRTYANMRVRGDLISYFRQKSGRTFKNEYIKGVGFTGKKVQMFWKAALEFISYDAPAYNGDDDSDTIGSQLADKGAPAILNETLDVVHSLLAKSGLTEKEQLVIRLFYFEHILQVDIAKRLGVTGERAGQIRRGALNKLRQHAIQLAA